MVSGPLAKRADESERVLSIVVDDLQVDRQIGVQMSSAREHAAGR